MSIAGKISAARFRLSFIAMLLVLLTACDKASDIPGLLLGGGGANRPQVVLSNPSTGVSNVSTNPIIFVEFNTDMNQERTRSAFSVSGSAAAEGDISWQGRRLIYTLRSPLQPGGSYVLRVGSSARSADGLTMEIDYIVHFVVGSTASSPAVASSIPTDNAQNVNAGSTIQVNFSRAMDQSSVQSAFGISPFVTGNFSWNAGSTSLTFTPNAPLQTGTTYSLSIATTAKDQEGIPLASASAISFQVGTDFTSPTIQSVMESGNPTPLVDGVTGVYKDSSFSLTFSEAMSVQSVQNNFSILNTTTSSSVTGVFNWNAGSTQVTFAPGAPLDPAGQYRLSVGAAAQDANGNTLGTDFNLGFTIDNSNGASNSIYLSASSASKTSPTPSPQAVSTDATILTTLNLPASAGIGGDTMRLEITFSHTLDANSIASNVLFSKVLGVHASQGQIIAMGLASGGGGTNNVLVIDFNSMGTNEYLIELASGTNGIRSAAVGGETGTWLQNNVKIHIKVVP